jgi:hypothetical protein
VFTPDVDELSQGRYPSDSADLSLKTLFPVQNKENGAMADHRQRYQITTRNFKNNILHGVTLLILISGDIAENPGCTTRF